MLVLCHFCLRMFLCTWNLFVKKINRLKTVAIASINYTTDMYLCQSIYSASIYMQYFYLWSSVRPFFSYLFLTLLFFMKALFYVYFLSFYENKQAYESHHLKQIFYHQKQIKFCRFHFFLLCFLLWILLILWVFFWWTECL